MTSMCAFLLGRRPWFWRSNLENVAEEPHHQRERNRVKKPAPQEVELLYSDELWDIVRSQPYLNSQHVQNNPNLVDLVDPALQARQESPPPMRSKPSNDSISIYSHIEMRSDDLRRTRAKTPVSRIGQLEEKACLDTWKEVDIARDLAQEYQNLLPSRCFTPFSKAAALNPHRNSLRRMKRHESLRDMVKSIPEDDEMSEFKCPSSPASGCPAAASPSSTGTSQESFMESHLMRLNSSRSRFLRGSFESASSRRDSSDSDTLIGSDSETSPSSPISRCLSNPDLDAIKVLQNYDISSMRNDLADSTATENDVGMQLCMDLLTKGLATGLHKQHPTEIGNKASGLQILLMIEAYEALQQQLRKEMLNFHVTDLSEDHVQAVEGTLDHWLQALRSIYERSLIRHETLQDCVAL